MTHELIVDSFAGGGGASMGITLALGRGPDVAINHDAAAIAMHRANHPKTRHFTEDVWKLSPRVVTKGKPVGLLWASPDCRHFSRAKTGCHHVWLVFPDGDEVEVAQHCEVDDAEDAADAINRFAKAKIRWADRHLRSIEQHIFGHPLSRVRLDQ